VGGARGGPALRLSPRQSVQLNVNGDPRRNIEPRFEFRVSTADDGRSSGRGASAGVALRVASRTSFEIGMDVDRRADDAQWVANFGSTLTDTAHFTFARLDQTTVGTTIRGNFTASPTLSFQLYAQPFISTGDFSRWRELASPRANAYADRFQPYGNGRDPGGFTFRQFNLNAVTRWEYRPGSMLFVVWQQGRLENGAFAGQFTPARDWRDLFRTHPDNTLLVKFSYWYNP
jgi:hypothetical protein